MLSWALLEKELIEQAKRKQTYTLRILFVSCLYSVYCAIYLTVLQPGANGGLGHGAKLFQATVSIQWAGILLLLPALTSHVISDERERNTLNLLIVSQIGLWQILLQKFISRLIPMFCLLLVALPLHAISFRSGGIEVADLIDTTSLQIGAIAMVTACSLFASANARSSSNAMIIAYAFSACTGFVIASLFEIVSAQRMTVALLASAVGVLLATRRNLEQHPDGVPVKNRLPFIRNRPSQSFVPDLALADAMENYPIAWREDRRLHQNRSWVQRNLLTLDMAVAVFFLLLTFIGELTQAGFLFWNQFPIVFFWYFVVIRLTLITINLFARERNAQTLDMLLTTPIDGFQILYQKMISLHQYVRSLWYPFGVYTVGRVLIMGAFSNLDFTFYVFPYLALGAACVWIYLPLFMWIAMWIGLKVRNRNKAILITLSLILIGSDLLQGLIEVLTSYFGLGGYLITFPAMLSPMAFIRRTESLVFYHAMVSPLESFGLVLFSAVAFYIYGRISRWLQRACTNGTENFLRRERD